MRLAMASRRHTMKKLFNDSALNAPRARYAEKQRPTGRTQ
jgi:hypothetical protein